MISQKFVNNTPSLYLQVELCGGAGVSLYVCAFKTGASNKRIRTKYVATKHIPDSSTFSVVKDLMNKVVADFVGK